MIRSDPIHTDYKSDLESANRFLKENPINSTATCYLNPKRITEARLDVAYTAWKWVISAIFGMLPVFLILLVALFLIMRNLNLSGLFPRRPLAIPHSRYVPRWTPSKYDVPPPYSE